MKIEILLAEPNLVLIDSESILDINYLNEIIHKELVKRNDLVESDTVTIRASKKEKYIIIHQHGSFDTNNMLKFFKLNMEEDNIEYSIREITKEEKEFLKDQFPVYCFLNNQYRGGPNTISDSDTIDPGIEDLCKAFNFIPGIQTFASCDGHNGSRPMYICYTAESLMKVEIMSYYLTRIIEKVLPTLNLNPNLIKIIHDISYMPDGIPTSVYFKFEIDYNKAESDKIYKFSKLIAEEIIHQVEIKNFGIIGSDEYYHFEAI